MLIFKRFELLPKVVKIKKGHEKKSGIYSIHTCVCMLSLPCLSELIRHFALHNLCDLNPTSLAASVAQLVERLP